MRLYVSQLSRRVKSSWLIGSVKVHAKRTEGICIIEARRGFWMTGDFDDLKFPVKWEIRVPWFVHRAKKKLKKKKKTKVQRSLIFLPFEIVAKFCREREFLSAKDFQDINNTKRWIRRKLRMDVKKIVKMMAAPRRKLLQPLHNLSFRPRF